MLKILKLGATNLVNDRKVVIAIILFIAVVAIIGSLFAKDIAGALYCLVISSVLTLLWFIIPWVMAYITFFVLNLGGIFFAGYIFFGIGRKR